MSDHGDDIDGSRPRTNFIKDSHFISLNSNLSPKSPVAEMESKIRGPRRMPLSSVEDLQSEESVTKPTFVNPINPQGNFNILSNEF